MGDHRQTATSVFRIGGVGAIAAAVGLAMAGGCGRIGYDLLPEESTAPEAGRPAGHQASAPGHPAVAEAAAAAVDAPAETAVGEDALDAPAEASSGADAPCSPSAVVDYCGALPPLPAPPLIDGVLDCGPALVPITPEDWRGAAPLPPFPAGNTSELAAAWRPDGIYVFMAVTTPAAIPADPGTPDYFGAGVEIFVDSDGVFNAAPAYNDPGTTQFIVTCPPYAPPDASAEACPSDASVDGGLDGPEDASGDASPEAAATGSPGGQRGEMYRNEVALGPWTSSRFGTFPTAAGFVFEGFVAAADLGLSTWQLAAGGQVGFDVAVDVSFPDVCTTGVEGHRAGQYFLHVGTAAADAAPDAAPIGPPYEDTRSFCTPTLASM